MIHVKLQIALHFVVASILWLNLFTSVNRAVLVLLVSKVTVGIRDRR